MTIDEYLDRAIANQRFKSDREVARTLGFRANPVSHWRTRRSWPSDDAMVTIATMAGVDPKRALADLDVWRSQTNEVREQRQEMAKLLEKIGAMVAIVGLGLGALLSAPTGTKAEQTDVLPAGTVHYQTLVAALRRLARRLLSGLAGPAVHHA